jgi:predicted MPP superfamily phosphohydrolase
MLFFTVFALAAFFLHLICFAAASLLKKNPSFKKFLSLHNRINLILLILSFIISTAAFIEGRKFPAVKELFFDTSSKSFVARDNPYRQRFTVMVLSGLHIDNTVSEKFLLRLAQRSAEINPDLIAIVGDSVDGTVENISPKVSMLSALKAKNGVIAVPGNHEYYSAGGFKPWQKFFDSIGIRCLVNDAVFYDPGVVFAGAAEYRAYRWKNEEIQQIPLTNQRAAALNGKVNILLAHQPQSAFEVLKLKDANVFDLQLSGHTHGGMIRGMDLFVAASNGNMVSGLYRLSEKLHVYVSNGSGIWNGFPLRLGRPTEITLLHLLF